MGIFLGLNNNIELTGKQVSKLEDRLIEVIQSEEERNTRLKK